MCYVRWHCSVFVMLQAWKCECSRFQRGRGGQTGGMFSFSSVYSSFSFVFVEGGSAVAGGTFFFFKPSHVSVKSSKMRWVKNLGHIPSSSSDV